MLNLKNIWILILLFTSLSVFSQRQEIHKTYSYYLSEGDSKWQETNTTFIFNYRGDEGSVKVYFPTESLELIQVGGTTEGFTQSGHKYQLLILRERGTTETIGLQYFEEQERFGVRVTFKDKTTMQFVE